MKHYQREFTADERLNNGSRTYPVPFSVFSRISPTTGNGKVVAIFGGKSNTKSTKQLVIENYTLWLNEFKWRIQIDETSRWFRCETVKGPAKKGQAFLRLIMVECLVKVEGFVKDVDRASFQILDQNNQSIINFDNLLVCNENPNRNFVDLAACTMVSDDHIYRIPEWLEYHRLIGFQRFTIHVDSPHFEIYQRFLQNYIDRHPNLLELVPLYFEDQRRPEDASRHDCLYRNRGFAKYTGVFDVDEFVNFKLKNQTLLQFLNWKTSNSRSIGAEILTFFYQDCNNKPIGDFSLALESFQVKQSDPIDPRRKSIYLTDHIFYVDAHFKLGGEHVERVDPFTEIAIHHYRYPTLHPGKHGYTLLRDSALCQTFSNRIKTELRRCLYVIEDVNPSQANFSCGN